MSQKQYACYSDLTNPALKDAININCLSTIRLATLVADFAQEMAKVHKQFSEDIQSIISSFRNKNEELKDERYMETPSTIHGAWECLMKEIETDAQAHMDASTLLIKNVFEPLQAVASHKRSQAQKLQAFRVNFEEVLHSSEQQFLQKEQAYTTSFNEYQTCGPVNNRDGSRQHFHNAHNDYVFQIRASNRVIEEFQIAIPQVLEELDEIYIDTSNTINVAIESHSLLLLTKANEQQRRFENLLKICRQVNPQQDISCFARIFSPEEARLELQLHTFCPPDFSMTSSEEAIINRLIMDKTTETALLDRKSELQKEALELTSYIKQNQEVTHTLVNICQRNLANHLYAKVYETQEDMCRKRNEIRIANMQLGALRAQIELMTPKQNGTVENDQDEKKSSSTIRGMWKKAFKSLKSSSSEPKLSKKGSLHKKKQNSKDDEDGESKALSGPVDPVYSLLKCAADLPKGGKTPCTVHPHCSGHHGSGGERTYMRYPSGGDSSGNTSKTSSPSSSASHSPKTRRKKLNARMKSFSLDTPEPPKQLLGIDESTKKKSSSFTNTYFGAKDTTDDKMSFSATSLRKKFALTKASSLEIEERKQRSYTPSPKESPKEKKKQVNLHVVVYNFKAKEKDDIDLRAGWRVNVTDSSKKDWWKGKCHGKSGYFPATYVIPVQPDQRVFQVLQPLNLADGNFGSKFHKDQVVLQIGEEVDGMVMIRAANKREAMCPLVYLQEL